MKISESMQKIIDQLIINAKNTIGNTTKVALPQAWMLLQLMVAEIIQGVQLNYPTLAGKDKKTIAMDLLSTVYDSVFIVVSVSFIPAFIQPIISKYIKRMLMVLLSATIDAMVITFKNTGIFKKTGDNNE